MATRMRWTGPLGLVVLAPVVALGLAACQTQAGARDHILAPLPRERLALPAGQVADDQRPAPQAPQAAGPTRAEVAAWHAQVLPVATTAPVLRRDGPFDVPTVLPASRLPAPTSTGATSGSTTSGGATSEGTTSEGTGSWYVGPTGSFLPNVGVGLHVGRVVHVDATSIWSVEAEGVWQFMDDKSFADDGNPEAGDWYQAKVGLKVATRAGAQRRTTWRAGLAWVRAEGQPNILQFPGDYYGGYVGLGFEADVGPRVTIGPELSLMAMTKNGSFTHGFVPQLSWRLSVWPCGRPASCDLPTCPGEVYAGGFASLSPAHGGGFQVGQRLRLDDAADWSFEVGGGVQSLTDGRLFSEGDGEWAQVRGGLKVALAPRERLHWTMRTGAAWMRTTARTEFLSQPADYFGLYAGLGLEADVLPQVRVGPELAAYLVTPEGSFEPEIVPQFLFHVLVRF